jgi:hypothetical protein
MDDGMNIHSDREVQGDFTVFLQDIEITRRLVTVDGLAARIPARSGQ